MTKDALNQRYDPMNRAELIAECERLRAELAIVTRYRDTLLEMSGHTLEQVARRIEKLRGGASEPETVEVTKKDLTISNCLHVEIGYGGNMDFLVDRSRSTSQVRFDLGQRIVITRGEDGLLVVSVERAADEVQK